MVCTLEQGLADSTHDKIILLEYRDKRIFYYQIESWLKKAVQCVLWEITPVDVNTLNLP